MSRFLWFNVYIYYPRQEGYVIPGVCLPTNNILYYIWRVTSFILYCIVLFVCWQLHVKTTDRIFVKILSEMLLWTRKSSSNFGSHRISRDGGLRSPSALVSLSY